MGQSKTTSQLANKATPALTDKLYLSDASTTPPTDKYITVAQLQTVGTVLETSLSLTAAQIKTLNSVPVQIVAAPGAGKAIEVVSGSVDFTFGAPAFDNSLIVVKTAGVIYQGGQVNANVLNSGASVFSKFSYNSALVLQLIANTALQVTAEADSTTTGTGTAKVYITYRIITL